jgi:hypothetical protein
MIRPLFLDGYSASILHFLEGRVLIFCCLVQHHVRVPPFSNFEFFLLLLSEALSFVCHHYGGFGVLSVLLMAFSHFSHFGVLLYFFSVYQVFLA